MRAPGWPAERAGKGPAKEEGARADAAGRAAAGAAVVGGAGGVGAAERGVTEGEASKGGARPQSRACAEIALHSPRSSGTAGRPSCSAPNTRDKRSSRARRRDAGSPDSRLRAAEHRASHAGTAAVGRRQQASTCAHSSAEAARLTQPASSREATAGATVSSASSPPSSSTSLHQSSPSLSGSHKAFSSLRPAASAGSAAPERPHACGGARRWNPDTRWSYSSSPSEP
eukprot:scaffold8684_cov112-Isochrysis_galbana.AAC.5